jgi:hypothetical protein
MHHRKDIHDDHYLNPFYDFVIFVLFVTCIEFYLQAIIIFEKPESVTNIRMHNLTHVSTLEREKTWGQKP